MEKRVMLQGKTAAPISAPGWDLIYGEGRTQIPLMLKDLSFSIAEGRDAVLITCQKFRQVVRPNFFVYSIPSEEAPEERVQAELQKKLSQVAGQIEVLNEPIIYVDLPFGSLPSLQNLELMNKVLEKGADGVLLSRMMWPQSADLLKKNGLKIRGEIFSSVH